jgi:microcompartment protein CcmK/EutM
MRIARVVGNVVSVVKDAKFIGYKLAIVAPLKADGSEDGPRQIVFDNSDAGVGDIVLLLQDGGGSNIVFDDFDIVSDTAIAGVIDYVTMDNL